MKVFVSQPMNGIPEDEILRRRDELFNLAKNIFGDRVELIDSYTKSQELEDRGAVAVLGDSIALMADAELVVFARDWNMARGCRVENMVAMLYSIPILFEHY